VIVEFKHINGQIFRLPAHQVVVYNDDGHPVSMSYETAGLMIHADANHPDFDNAITELKIRKIDPKTVKRE
jgi:hypothetical protein